MDSRIFDFLIFLQTNVDFWILPVGFGVCPDLQSMGNDSGFHMDGFSSHFEPYGSILDDLHDFDDFAIVSDGLTLFP